MCYVLCAVCYKTCPMCTATLGSSYSPEVDTERVCVHTFKNSESPCWKDAAVGIINTPGTYVLQSKRTNRCLQDWLSPWPEPKNDQIPGLASAGRLCSCWLGLGLSLPMHFLTNAGAPAMSSSQHLLLWSPQLTPWSVSSLMRCDRPNDYSLILGSQGGSIWTMGDSTQMLDCETKWAVSPSLTRLPKERRLQPAPGVEGLLASHPGLPLEEASSLCARWLRGGGCVWFMAL